MDDFATDPQEPSAIKGKFVAVDSDPLSQSHPLHDSSATEEEFQRPAAVQRASASAAPPTTPVKGAGGSFSAVPVTPSTEQKAAKKLYSQYFRQFELLIE